MSKMTQRAGDLVADIVRRHGADAAELAAVGERALSRCQPDHARDQRDGDDQVLRRRLAIADRAGIPREYSEAALGQLEPRAALQAVEEMRRDGVLWGLLCGGLGSGKSTAAARWLMTFHLPQSAPVRRWVDSREVAGLAMGTVTHQARWEALANADALVLDDVGWKDGQQIEQQIKQKDGKYAAIQVTALAGAVQDLIEVRWKHRRATLMTSNLVPAQFSGYLGDERLRDRWSKRCVVRGTADANLRAKQ